MGDKTSVWCCGYDGRMNTDQPLDLAAERERLLLDHIEIQRRLIDRNESNRIFVPQPDASCANAVGYPQDECEVVAPDPHVYLVTWKAYRSGAPADVMMWSVEVFARSAHEAMEAITYREGGRGYRAELVGVLDLTTLR
jgi:hypothetical protein